MTQTKEQELIQSMKGDQESAKILAEYLGYEIGKNPVDPDGETRIFFTDKTGDMKSGVLAVLPVKDLSPQSSTVEVRKLYEQVLEIKNKKLSVDFTVPVIGFIGQKRLVFFKTVGGNRDTRLDLNPETIDKDLYIRNFSYLKNDSIIVETSPFGFGSEVKISDKAFERELSTSFLTMVSMYRKKLSEWITATDLKKELYDLVDDEAKKYIENDDIKLLVQNDSYKSVLSTVVDTISLRQLMRRFLEGYYGADSFNVNGIALGVGSGTLDEAIQRAVTIAKNVSEERKIKKLNHQRKPIKQMDLFSLGFTDDEMDATSKVQVKEGQSDYLANLSEKATEQFKLAYGGDLFAGSIGEAATKIDQRIARDNNVDWVKPYVDTAAGNYSFRFEDMPPEAIEKQYEDSMSQNVQITLNKETNQPEVFFGDDEAEQKTKGAYYTDQRFVEYMVKNTVEVAFQDRFKNIKKAIKGNNLEKIDQSIKALLDLKIADFTCGGGSFLRGAFLKLADQFQLINSLNYPQKIRDKYNFLSNQEDSQYQWEDYILKHMIYGVDIDYKATIISSLTLTLSTLEHKPKNTKLPQLIGRTLIHQNSLINAVPYKKREEIFKQHQKEIATLRKLKSTDFKQFIKLRDKLTAKVIISAGDVAKYANLLKIGCIELALPEVYFNKDGSLNTNGGMDIVIGNPPWEVWKPNSDDFYAEYDKTYRQLSKKEKRKRAEELNKQIPTLQEKRDKENARVKAGAEYFHDKDAYEYQSWKVNGRRTGSDPNLYKLSVERFVQLARPDAYFSILVPDSFATDLGASGIRHLLFDHFNVTEFLSFENYHKQIFQAVHASYKFAVLTFDEKQPSTKTFKAFFKKHSLDLLNNDSTKMDYQAANIRKYEPEKYSLVEAKSKELNNLYDKIRNSFPSLGESQLLEFSKGLDKSGDHNFYRELGTDDYVIPLYQGRNIEQFEIRNKPQDGAKEGFARQSKMSEGFDNYRIVIRDVSGSSNKRTLIATLLPKRSLCSDSLHFQKNAETMTIENKLFYLGLLNSYVLDYIIRNIVSTHVNQTFVKQLPMPGSNQLDDSDRIISIVKTLLTTDKDNYGDLQESTKNIEVIAKDRKYLIAELNARIMKDYLLNRQEIVVLMKTFESPTHKKHVQAETQRILDVYDKLTEGANNE